MVYTRTSLNVRNTESEKFPTFLFYRISDPAKSSFKVVCFKIEMIKCT